MFTPHSIWFVLGALAAIVLLGTVSSLGLQRMFGNHVTLVAIGPVICVFGVLIFMAVSFRDRSE
jgi:hypothetical protein